MTLFNLHSPYEPSGDQPQAISLLTQGLREGAKHQTILGVTGSGKSVTADTKILLHSKNRYYHLPIGILGDQFDCMPTAMDATQCISIPNKIKTLAFDTESGDVLIENVNEISRHRYQGILYTITTKDGRKNTFTDSHNVFVLQNGILNLIKSENLQVGDLIPTPKSIPQPSEFRLDHIKTIEWVTDKNFRVALEKNAEINQKNISSEQKRILKNGGTIAISEYRNLTEEDQEKAASVGTASKKARIPSKIHLNYSFMRFVGLFIAEGCISERFISISSGDQMLVDEIKNCLNELGIELKKSKSRVYDYHAHGKTLANLLSNVCGIGARRKHLPVFWPQLDNEQLGWMLSGIYAGDGCAEKNQITLSSVSHELVSDIQIALSRFGISSVIKRKKGKYNGTEHLSWLLSISSKSNCLQFQKHIGFNLPRKDFLLKKICEKENEENTNTDIFPLPIALVSEITKKYRLKQKDLAKAAGSSRSLISMYMKNKRQPERKKSRKIAEYLLNIVQDNEKYTCDLQKYIYLSKTTWSPIVAIEKRNEDTVVYDISVPKIQTFLANGYFVHNTFTAAHVIAESGRPAMVMAPNKTLAAQLYQELKSFFPNHAVEYFVSYYDYYQPEAYIPSTDTFVDKDAQINEQIEQMRLSATKSLMERKDVIVVASVSAIYGLGDPNEFFSMALQLKKGEHIDQRELLKKLTNMQYARNDTELKRGTFRVRGEVIDVFPADHDKYAVRIELFDGEIDSIKIVDPLTGQLGKSMLGYTLFPKSHYVTTRQRTLEAVESIKEELKERLEVLYAQNKLVEAQRLEQRTKYDIEMMLEVGYCNGVENYSRHLTKQKAGDPPPTLFDYLPDDAVLFIDESHVTVPQIGAMFKGDRSRKQTLVDFGFRLPSAMDNRPLKFEEWEQRLPPTVFVSATPGPYEIEHTPEDHVVELVVRPTGLVDPEVEIRPQGSQVDDLLGEIKKRVKAKERVLVTTLTKKMAEHLTQYFHDQGINIRYLHSDIDTLERIEILRDLRLGTFDVLVGINLLREGLDLPEVSLVAILDADKEGFLRSTRSLIQTIGRAARNINGKAILYADRITPSMQAALDETSRRRDKQIEYNKKHGITPQGVVRQVEHSMQGLDPNSSKKDKKNKQSSASQDDDQRIILLAAPQAEKELAEMEKTMFEHAKNLEFELASALRDRIAKIKEQRLIQQ